MPQLDCVIALTASCCPGLDWHQKALSTYILHWTFKYGYVHGLTSASSPSATSLTCSACVSCAVTLSCSLVILDSAVFVCTPHSHVALLAVAHIMNHTPMLGQSCLSSTRLCGCCFMNSECSASKVAAPVCVHTNQDCQAWLHVMHSKLPVGSFG